MIPIGSGSGGVAAFTLLLRSTAAYGSFPEAVIDEQTVTNANSSAQVSLVTLAQNTATTLTAPTGAYGVVIVPDSANATAITLKGVAGDTGIPLSKTAPMVLTFPAGSASFVLKTDNTGTALVKIIWF